MCSIILQSKGFCFGCKMACCWGFFLYHTASFCYPRVFMNCIDKVFRDTLCNFIFKHLSLQSLFLTTGVMLCGGKYYMEFDDDAEGIITRRYELSDEYFNDLQQDEIKSGKLEVLAELHPIGGVFHLHFEIFGRVEVVCDRCLDLVSLPVDIENDTDISFSDLPEAEESDTAILLPEGTKGIDLAWYFYEAVLLSLPTKRVHPDGQCNSSMQDLLDRYGGNGDKESDFSDPRWDSLKNLKQND